MAFYVCDLSVFIYLIYHNVVISSYIQLASERKVVSLVWSKVKRLTWLFVLHLCSIVTSKFLTEIMRFIHSKNKEDCSQKTEVHSYVKV